MVLGFGCILVFVYYCGVISCGCCYIFVFMMIKEVVKLWVCKNLICFCVVFFSIKFVFVSYFFIVIRKVINMSGNLLIFFCIKIIIIIKC